MQIDIPRSFYDTEPCIHNLLMSNLHPYWLFQPNCYNKIENCIQNKDRVQKDTFKCKFYCIKTILPNENHNLCTGHMVWNYLSFNVDNNLFEIYVLLNPTVSAFKWERYCSATFGTIQLCILNISIHRESWKTTDIDSLLSVQTWTLGLLSYWQSKSLFKNSISS